jgi:hypothetical protein
MPPRLGLLTRHIRCSKYIGLLHSANRVPRIPGLTRPILTARVVQLVSNASPEELM